MSLLVLFHWSECFLKTNPPKVAFDCRPLVSTVSFPNEDPPVLRLFRFLTKTPVLRLFRFLTKTFRGLNGFERNRGV